MNSPRQVIGLDVIRFLAAFGVMTFHVSYWAWAHPDGTPGRVTGGTIRFASFTSLTSAAWVGVDVFFVLSGFVILRGAIGAARHHWPGGQLWREPALIP